MLAAGAALLAVAAAVGIVTGCGDDGGDSAEGPAFCPAGEDSGGDSPIGFFGLDSQTSDTAAQYRTMRCGGAHSVRLYVPWGAVNPAPGTYDWSDLDRSVLRAADAELDPLLFVYLTPAWTVQEGDLPAPRSPGRIGATLPVQNATQIAAWQGFLRALVRRYGPDGSLWQAAGAGHRYGPVRLWQIWNEPNLGLFSWPRADPVAFARLQSLGYEAIHDADPGATVLTGGLSAVTVGPAQVDYGRFLAEMIRATPDSQRSFDALAIHPYAPSSADVVRVLDRARGILDQNGLASTPIWVTEIGWSSFSPCRSRPTQPGQRSVPLPDCDPGELPLFKGVRGQARVLAQTMRSVVDGRDRWGLDRVYVFAWRDLPPSDWSSRCAFCLDAGLVSWRALPDGSPVPKPSWRVFERLAR